MAALRRRAHSGDSVSEVNQTHNEEGTQDKEALVTLTTRKLYSHTVRKHEKVTFNYEEEEQEEEEEARWTQIWMRMRQTSIRRRSEFTLNEFLFFLQTIVFIRSNQRQFNYMNL